MSNQWLKDWKVIDLLDLVEEISGNDKSHPVYNEWEYQIQNGGRNSAGTLSWVGEDEGTPIINQFLLENGFTKGERIMFWVSW